MITSIIPKDSTRDISTEVLQPDGKVKLMLASEWKKYPWNDFRMFCHDHARYGIPTIELINFLYSMINATCPLSECIEIGAGAGDLGRHLGIRMTDSRMQENSKIKLIYDAAQQPVIKYPDDVEKLEATEAIYKYKPKVVIASWMTTWASQEMHYASSPHGVRELEILGAVKKFILIGNIDVHGDKPIMAIEHQELDFDWLVSRAKNQENNRIWIWNM